MKLGRFTIEQLNEGQFEFYPDGDIIHHPVSASGKHADVQGRNNLLAGINPIYVTDGTHNILLDAGLGRGFNIKNDNKYISNVRTNLNIFGVDPAEITHVILSHLHYDHVAGASYTDAYLKTRPTFPNARYYLQQDEWDFAVRQVQNQSIQSPFYNLDDLYRLYADCYFEFIEKDEAEIIPGLNIVKTGGHTPGHQVVRLQDQEKKAYYLGDLIATPDQLNIYDLKGTNSNRITAKKMKVKLLKEVFREKALLFFYHSVHSNVGWLQKDEDRNYVLREI